MMILRRVTFPVVAPAFAAAFILTFGKTIGQFALPFLLGAPTQFHTVATMVYATLALGLDSMAYVLAIDSYRYVVDRNLALKSLCWSKNQGALKPLVEKGFETVKSVWGVGVGQYF